MTIASVCASVEFGTSTCAAPVAPRVRVEGVVGPFDSCPVPRSLYVKLISNSDAESDPLETDESVQEVLPASIPISVQVTPSVDFLGRLAPSMTATSTRSYGKNTAFVLEIVE